MNNYELTVVLPGGLTDAKQNATLEKIKGLVDQSGGSIAKTDKWGKRALAYPIKKQTEGVYYLLGLSLDPEKTNPISRIIENDDQILRHLMIRVDKLDVPEEKAEEKTKKIEKKKSK